MERQLNDHENRIRVLENKVSSLRYQSKSNTEKLDKLLPKVDSIVEQDKLEDKLAMALEANNTKKWGRKEHTIAWLVAVATVANTLLNVFPIWIHTSK